MWKVNWMKVFPVIFMSETSRAMKILQIDEMLITVMQMKRQKHTLSMEPFILMYTALFHYVGSWLSHREGFTLTWHFGFLVSIRDRCTHTNTHKSILLWKAPHVLYPHHSWPHKEENCSTYCRIYCQTDCISFQASLVNRGTEPVPGSPLPLVLF